MIELNKRTRPSRTGTPFPAPLVWTLLFVARAAALFTGIDRLPLVPAAPPEVIINDPAVALSRGYGLAALSFEHSLNHLNIVYANFPPLYMALQSLVFRVLGFSAMTLRVPGVLADLAACVIFLLVLRELYARKIVDRLGATLAGAILLAESGTLIHDRSGRMESVCVLFGSLTLYLCVRADTRGRRQVLLTFAAAIAAGLALATHFESLLICVALALWTLPRIRQLRFGWVALNALPLVVLLAVWSLAYGHRSLEAFHNLRQLAVYAPKPSLDIAGVVRSVAGGDPRAALQSGGLPLVVVLAALGLGAWRILAAAGGDSRGHAPAEWKSSLVRFTAIVLVQCVLIQLIVPGFGSTRIVLVVPFAVMCLAAGLSWMRGPIRKFAITGAAVLVLLQFGVTIGYLGQLRHTWQERRPQRYDDLIAGIPADARVVAVPEFWFAFLSNNRRLALMYHADDEFKYWSDEPRAFDPYDVVILDPGTPEYGALHAKARVGRPVEYLLKTSSRVFTVDARVLDLTRLERR